MDRVPAAKKVHTGRGGGKRPTGLEIPLTHKGGWPFSETRVGKTDDPAGSLQSEPHRIQSGALPGKAATRKRSLRSIPMEFRGVLPRKLLRSPGL